MTTKASAVSLLRAASYRISSAAPNDLPRLVAHLATSLVSCKQLLSSPEASNKDSDAAVVLHRFNTQISSLLQDRTVQGRWAAIVLVKAVIEAGGWETLRKSNAWVRPLLAILKKPDPPTTRCLCILALTRIFTLTRDYPTLVREITTPALPTFVSTCLSNLAARPYSQHELRTTLESFAQLLPHHPTIFRTHQTAISQLIVSTIESSTSRDITQLACRISVLLHQCEPKGGAAQKWETSLAATVRLAHSAADKALIAVQEDWQSVAGNNINKHALLPTYNNAQESKAPSDRPVQQFVSAGAESLKQNLHLLTTYFSLATNSHVTASLGSIADLLTRLFAVTISHSASRTSVKFLPGTDREQRDALACLLPDIHVAALELLSTLLDRYGHQLTPALHSFFDQLLWIFHAESSNVAVRTAVYAVMHKLLQLIGPTMTKQSTASMRRFIVACCDDLMPAQEEKPTQANPDAAKPAQGAMNADSFLRQSKASSVLQTQFAGLHKAAHDLLPIFLSNLPSKHVPVAIRSQIDRAAVVSRHKDAMVASTLNHPLSDGVSAKTNSLLPLLAREFPQEPQVETLLRPRMPVIETGRRSTGQVNGGAEDEDEHESDIDVDEVLDDAEENENDDDDDDDVLQSEEQTGTAEANKAMEEPTHNGRDLVNQALHAYNAREPTNAAEKEVVIGTAEKSTEVLGKRARSPGPSSAGKRQRSTSVALDQPQANLMVATSTAPSATAEAGAEESDDEEFEIPQLVMGSDSEDEE